MCEGKKVPARMQELKAHMQHGEQSRPWLMSRFAHRIQCFFCLFFFFKEGKQDGWEEKPGSNYILCQDKRLWMFSLLSEKTASFLEIQKQNES